MKKVLICGTALILLLSLLFLFFEPEGEKYLTKITSGDFVLSKEDISPQSLLAALDLQIKLFNRILKYGKKDSRKWSAENYQYTTEEMLAATQKFREIYTTSENMKILKERLEKYFNFYKFCGPKGKKVLMTGYYTPIIKASRRKTKRFKYPIYRLPDDLFRIDLSKFNIGVKKQIVALVDANSRQIRPYYTREEIDWKNVLSGRNLEIAYLENYLDQFYLHIQGGGILEIDESETNKPKRIYVNYKEKNGRKFSSLEGALIRNNKMSRDTMSMYTTKEYFKKNPHELKQYAVKNKSYIFYTEGKRGPFGNLNIIVTPGRSIATDKKIFSGGFIAFVTGRYGKGRNKRFRRFVLDQDTGGAIKKNHIDLYCGEGKEGGNMAAYMKDRGDVTFILPKKSVSN